MINGNKLAVSAAIKEGGKIQVNIAQIKEVQKCTFKALAKFKASEVMALIEKYK